MRATGVSSHLDLPFFVGVSDVSDEPFGVWSQRLPPAPSVGVASHLDLLEGVLLVLPEDSLPESSSHSDTVAFFGVSLMSFEEVEGSGLSQRLLFAVFVSEDMEAICNKCNALVLFDYVM